MDAVLSASFASESMPCPVVLFSHLFCFVSVGFFFFRVFAESQEVYVLTSGVHALATQILAPSTRKILQAEGVRNLTPLAFYEWCHEKRGFGKVHIFKDVG